MNDRILADLDRALSLLSTPSRVIRCPECASDDYPERRWRAPGVAADDCTLSWRQCGECGHQSEPV